MNHNLLKITYLFISLPLLLQGQSLEGTWKQLPLTSELSTRMNAGLVLPSDAKAYLVDVSVINNLLMNARSSEQIQMALPLGPEGEEEIFNMTYDPIMGIMDQKKFSDILTFRAVSTDGKGKLGRIGISSLGFYGIFESEDGQTIIRHGNGEEKDKVFIYDLDRKMALVDPLLLGVCGTESAPKISHNFDVLQTRDEIRKMRNYRLAISCTSGFATIAGGSESAVMAKVVEAVNLLNLRYHVDFGFRMTLIDNNERLFNLSAATDYFVDQTKGLGLLRQNQNFIDSLLSPEDYDLSQVFTKVCSDVGGVVSGRACDDNSKARGVSCRSSDEDYFFTTFKHEMGHQFNGGHTFNACNGSTQYDPESSYEPGAGSTILSYGNNCGDDNVGTRKDYFHVINIIEMTTYAMETEALCGTLGTDINHAPVAKVSYPSGVLTIPILTPFELTGTGTDIDGTGLTYNWEQFDLGTGDPLGTNFETGPLFASQDPRNAGATRLIPKLADVLSGAYTKSERMPEVSRELNFKMTIRDNDQKVGATDIADFKFESTIDAGPFQVTFPSKEIDTIFTVGQHILVQWDVANTDQSPVNCKFVNIMLSNNDGLTFPDTLVYRTPNDGSEYIMLYKATTRGRVKVKAADNIFLDISKKSMRVVLPPDAGYSVDAFPHDGATCLYSTFAYQIKSIQWNGFTAPIKLEITDPGNDQFIIAFEKDNILPGETIKLNVDARNVDVAGTYVIKFMATAEGADTVWSSVNLVIGEDDQPFAGVVSPINLNQEVSVKPIFQWNKTTSAASYEFELATNPSFDEESVIYGLETDLTKFTYNFNLESKTIYFWRVRAMGDCGWGRWSETNIFRTSSAESPNTLEQINNQVLKVKTNNARFIGHDDLYHTSVQEPNEDLTYTLLAETSHGSLNLNGSKLSVGQQFTQDDIDNGIMHYNADQLDYQGADRFDFLVYDSQATFIGPYTMLIDINDQNPLSTKEDLTKVDHLVTLFPSPSSGQVTLTYAGKVALRDATVMIYNVNGNAVWSKNYAGSWNNSTLDLNSLTSGTYVLVLKSGNYISKKRLVKL
ncbi:MAG: T9SS type A sorting domain-containing protein [Saprospiraceae bacterium]|nr:T9SS type A sorting domain-containing protein [Candidatus Brachybacter algidus]